MGNLTHLPASQYPLSLFTDAPISIDLTFNYDSGSDVAAINSLDTVDTQSYLEKDVDGDHTDLQYHFHCRWKGQSVFGRLLMAFCLGFVIFAFLACCFAVCGTTREETKEEKHLKVGFCEGPPPTNSPTVSHSTSSTGSLSVMFCYVHTWYQYRVAALKLIVVFRISLEPAVVTILEMQLSLTVTTSTVVALRECRALWGECPPSLSSFGPFFTSLICCSVLLYLFHSQLPAVLSTAHKSLLP